MSISDLSAFPAIANELRQVVERALLKLRTISESGAARPLAPGKWSPKQVIGHLIDSAGNNHQRFVRAQETSTLELPGYEQDHWVRCQRYDDRSWDEIIALWHGYNRHLAHVIGHIPEAMRSVPCRIGASATVTLGFLVHDYIVHLQHHLKQVSCGDDERVGSIID